MRHDISGTAMQSMPILAKEITRHLPSEKAVDAGAGAGIGRLVGGCAAIGGFLGSD